MLQDTWAEHYRDVEFVIGLNREVIGDRVKLIYNLEDVAGYERDPEVETVSDLPSNLVGEDFSDLFSSSRGS